MQVGVNVPNFGEFADPRRVAELAAATEQAGWDGLFVWDHIYWYAANVVGDPWVQLAAAAAVTERISLGTMVTPLPRRRPWVVARQAVSLDQLSNGRFVLGVGIGFPPEEEFGVFGEPTNARTRADMLDESLEIILGLWTGEEFSFAGDHYSLDPVIFRPTPVQQPRIPIWVAGMWPNRRPFRRAARFDGVFPINTTGGEMGPMTAHDLAEMHAYMAPHRTAEASLTTSVYYFGGGEEELAAQRAAGVDWLHVGGPPGSTFDDILSMVRSGPPR